MVNDICPVIANSIICPYGEPLSWYYLKLGYYLLTKMKDKFSMEIKSIF